MAQPLWAPWTFTKERAARAVLTDQRSVAIEQVACYRVTDNVGVSRCYCYSEQDAQFICDIINAMNSGLGIPAPAVEGGAS